MFRTIDGPLSKEEWKNELVFSFGKSVVDDTIPKEYVYRIPNCKFVKAEKLCAKIDAKMFKHGLTFVADEAVGIKDGPALQEFQTYLIAEYYKKHFFTMLTPVEPSPTIQGVLGGLKDPSRSINQMNNMPWLLRHPLAGKLEDKRIGLPLLILMSGPSLHLVKKHLKSLSQHFLIVCIARSLQPCLEAGVEPDFVVQYDTNLEQRHFYEAIPQLKKTVLISLSSACVADYAWKFRGIFFRAAFNGLLLNNPYIMKDSIESSLMACMGLAEVLGAPKALIAGANLSWSKEGEQYSSEENLTNLEGAISKDYRVLQDSCGLNVIDRNGEKTVSNLVYVAAAARASEFAKEIQASVGTNFFLTSNNGIMSPTEFPTASLDVMLETPLLDRDTYLEKVDEAINTKESIDLETCIQYFQERANFLSSQELNFRIRKHNPEFEFEYYNELVSLMNNIRSFILPILNNDRQVHNFVEQWACAYKYATKISLAYLIAKTNTLPALFVESEYTEIEKNIDNFFPEKSLELLELSCFTNHNNNNRKTLEDRGLGLWLKEQKLVFVSQEILHRYNYLFDTLEDDNIIALPHFERV